MKRIIAIVVFIVLFSQVSSVSYGQTDTVPTNNLKIWGSFGFGTAGIHDDVFASGSFDFSVLLDHHFFSFAAVGGDNMGAPSNRVETFTDVGLLYGYGIYNELWHGIASVGLSYYSTLDVHSSPTVGQLSDTLGVTNERFRQIGLPWQLNVFSRFSKDSDAGLGFKIAGNINKHASYYILHFTLVFGKF